MVELLKKAEVVAPAPVRKLRKVVEKKAVDNC